MSLSHSNPTSEPRLRPFALGFEVANLPARLLGVPFPSTDFFASSELSGVRWIVCLAGLMPERRYEVGGWPIAFLERTALGRPLGTDQVTAREVARLALLAQAKLRTEEGVLVHCDMGIDRTGAVVGTILALEGYSPEGSATAIARVLSSQQPGWIGQRFPSELAAAIRTCAAFARG